MMLAWELTRTTEKRVHRVHATQHNTRKSLFQSIVQFIVGLYTNDFSVITLTITLIDNDKEMQFIIYLKSGTEHSTKPPYNLQTIHTLCVSYWWLAMECLIISQSNENRDKWRAFSLNTHNEQISIKLLTKLHLSDRIDECFFLSPAKWNMWKLYIPGGIFKVEQA